MKIIDVKKSRFRDADWFEKADTLKTPIVIGGAGGIGSWLVLFLSRILNNCTDLYLFDFDSVEEVNIGKSPYNESCSSHQEDEYSSY